ncbi:leucine-rich repeat and immunoglobulin-like domain-containing nogo receptor-interacting protein 2b [Chanos chanos]|uniref:leucine-rich repeat and immunoglobulin-like domain-containing nogo receptor-interacting protein 2b n=1 Tax=Chanos chanos TaxID=29144 RepID=UPI0011F33B86|nr:leucine-rich repeat and immunoglobulin-like domain-containing nogo receptor-interacting protein 2 [Chanos chanos]
MLFSMMCCVLGFSLLPLLLFPSPVHSCPTRCECSVHTRSVSCHRKRLVQVPEGIPIETRSLDLSKNRLRTITPQNFSSLLLLEELDLSSNLIASIESGSFRAQPRLRSLRLRSNQLTLLPRGALAGLGELTLLDVSQNRLVILLDYAFEEQRRLRVLELTDNELVFIAPRAFSGLSSLRSLTLQRCNLSAVPTHALAHLHGLTTLRLRELGIADLQPHPFKGLGRLRHLEVDSWPELEAIPTPALQGLNLSTLSITRTNISLVPMIRHLIFLTHLNVSYSRVRVLPAGWLRGLERLEELRVRQAQLQNVESGAFQGALSLRLLDLSHNHLTTLEMSTIPTPDNLQSLLIGQNPLVCDCRLRWLLQRTPPFLFGEVQPECSAPAALAKKPLREVVEPLLSRYVTCTKPRVVSVATQPSQAEEGQRAWLHCSAVGAPPPSVSWVTPHRRHITIKSTGRLIVHNNGSLEFRVAEPQDSGVYICVASNPAGNTTLSVSLAVKSLGVRDRALYMNRSMTFDPDYNISFTNGTERYTIRVVLDFTTILVSTAMGCLSFLGVVLFCFLLLFAWSRGKGKHRGSVDIQYVPRKRKGANTEIAETSGPRRVNMKMI